MTHLFFRIIVFNNLNDFSNIEAKFVQIFSLVFIASLYLVKNTWWKVFSVGTCNKKTNVSHLFAYIPLTANLDRIVKLRFLRFQTFTEPNCVLDQSHGQKDTKILTNRVLEDCTLNQILTMKLVILQCQFGEAYFANCDPSTKQLTVYTLRH